MKIYVAGPMTGIEAFNYPAFAQEKSRLEHLGYRTASPADMNMEGKEFSWEDCMKEALKMMLSCDAISLLPGWERSRGASIEIGLAREIGMQVYMPYALTMPSKGN